MNKAEQKKSTIAEAEAEQKKSAIQTSHKTASIPQKTKTQVKLGLSVQTGTWAGVSLFGLG